MNMLTFEDLSLISLSIWTLSQWLGLTCTACNQATALVIVGIQRPMLADALAVCRKVGHGRVFEQFDSVCSGSTNWANCQWRVHFYSLSKSLVAISKSTSSFGARSDLAMGEHRPSTIDWRLIAQDATMATKVLSGGRADRIGLR